MTHSPAGARTRWRAVVDWVLGDREDIDQEGLLAERTLGVGDARRRREDDDGTASAAPADDA